MATNRSIDEIFADLESSMNDSESIDDVLKRVSQRGEAFNINITGYTNTKVVHRPTRPDINSLGEFVSRYDTFKKIIEKVNYGVGNATEYVNGHADALKKYYAQGQSDSNDLTLVESRVSEEIHHYEQVDKTNVYVKGYYDGLIYVYRALKDSKDLALKQIYQKLKKGLGDD